MTSKFMGQVFDGRWKVIDTKPANDGRRKHYINILENIYNKETIEIETRALNKVANGETTISHIMYSRLNKKGYGKKSMLNFKRRNK